MIPFPQSVLRYVLLCALSLCASLSLAQSTLRVGPGQTYTTIQAGIDAASPGDTVLVSPGTYNENIDFKGKAITVKSSDGAAKTIIDGGARGPAVKFATHETSAATISGFTIQHGGEFGWVEAYLYYGVGNIYLANSAPTIINNIITEGNCWGIESNASAPIVQNNVISATQDPHGNCDFGGGAAIILWGGTYDGTTARYPFVSGNTIENNVQSGLEDAGGNGGAIAVWGGSPIIQNNIIRNNASPGGSGAGINIVYNDHTVIAQNLIYGNNAGCGGGAIATNGYGTLIINNTIVDNVGDNTGGFSECAKIAQIYPSPDTYGADSPTDVFINNIISGSTSYPAVNCSWFQPPSESIQPTFQNNILYNAGGPFFGSFCVDVSNKYNNIAADPQFVNQAGHDYHLKSTSPAIDAGQNAALQTFQTQTGAYLLKDFDGKQRIQDFTGKGCIVDIGAYEYPGTASECGTIETLNSSLNPAAAGQTVTFTAQLVSSLGTPTGSIEFLDGTTHLATQTVSSTGAASYTTSALAVGKHTITANYAPTGAFSAASASMVETITGDTTTTALTCSPATIDISGTAQLTATVASAQGTPTGSVSFTDNGSPLATSNLVAGATSLTYTGSVAGSHTITAAYTPTGAFAPSSATCTETVNPLPTTSVLTVTPPNSIYASPITLTATVSPATPPGPSTPTGTVTFYNGSSVLGTGTLAGGVATLGTNSLPGGSNTLSCIYSGSSIYAASNCSPVPVTVNPAPSALSLVSTSNPAAYLSPVALKLTLTLNGKPAAAGMSLHLTINGQTANLTTDATGSASYTMPSLPPGSYPATAAFAGTSNFEASSDSLTEVIIAARTATGLTATPNPGNQNQPVTLTATVASGPNPVGNGNVTFYDGSTSLGTSALDSSGTATLNATFTVLGAHDLTAVYAGNADFLSSTSPIFKETITAGDFSIRATPGGSSVYTGQSSAVQVSVASINGFAQPLALSCSGLPANTTCAFTPAAFSNGQGDTRLVIQTSAPQHSAAASLSILGLLALVFLPGWKRRSVFLRLGVLLVALGAAASLSGCASADPISAGTPPGKYHVAVTASTTGPGAPLVHSADVTLTVKSLF